MLQIATRQEDLVTIAPHQTAILHVDSDCRILSISEDAVQLLAACRDVVEVTAQGLLLLPGVPDLQALLEEACMARGPRDGQRELYSEAAQVRLTFHILPHPEVGACLVVFSSGLDPARPARHLTPREWDVLFLVAKGMRRERMAHKLGIAVATIDLHCANLRRKMGARTTAEAVAKALARRELDKPRSPISPGPSRSTSAEH